MIFENKLVQQRIQKVEALRESGLNPYSNDSRRDITIEKFLFVNSDIHKKENKRDEKRSYTISGRIKLLRIMGKASFITLEDESRTLQIYIARDNLPEGFYNDIFKKLVDVGDIIEVSGFPFITGQGFV